LEKVQNVLGVKSTSLGSFSEAGNVFDHTLLPPMVKALAQKALPQETDPRLKDLGKPSLPLMVPFCPLCPR
jgi:hypothetical protein